MVDTFLDLYEEVVRVVVDLRGETFAHDDGGELLDFGLEGLLHVRLIPAFIA